MYCSLSILLGISNIEHNEFALRPPQGIRWLSSTVIAAWHTMCVLLLAIAGRTAQNRVRLTSLVGTPGAFIQQCTSMWSPCTDFWVGNVMNTKKTKAWVIELQPFHLNKTDELLSKCQLTFYYELESWFTHKEVAWPSCLNITATNALSHFLAEW